MKRSYASILIPLVVLCGVGCGDGEAEEAEEERLGEGSSALHNDNAMNPNAMNPNAMNPNGLRPIALTLSALSPDALVPEASAAIQDPESTGALAREHLKYTVSCALEPTQSFSFSWTDLSGVVHSETYWGLLGLARGWASHPLSEDEKRWISACLAARANFSGVSVTISSRGPCAALNQSNTPEASTYTIEEGAFWGNIYEGSGAVYACNRTANEAHSRLLRRECAAGHVDLSSGDVQPCSGIQRLGSCATYCEPLTKKGLYHPWCFNDPADPGATTNQQPITVFLLP